MGTFISILRGINVSGQRKILMADLKALYEDLKFDNIVSYIQSGNVIFNFNGKRSHDDLVRRIEEAIFQKYHFEVPVILRTLEEMQSLFSVNPFLKESDINIEKLHVTFLAQKPDSERLEKIKESNYPPDRFFIVDREVFLHCPDRYGETKLSNRFFESKLKVSATTRNWKTIGKLIDLAQNV